MFTKMKMVKRILKQLKIVNDYISFITFYKECSSLSKFLVYRYLVPKKKNGYWPVHPNSEVRGNIVIGKGARIGHRPNCIIQGRGRVFVGDYVGMGPNSVIISGNHSLTNQEEVVRKETIIGDYCWIASSCNILAGVVLGPRTIVGAGSVVTKSFPEGYCVIAGNPAKVIKYIDKEEFVQRRPKVEYYGYLRGDKYSKYAERHLNHIKFDYDLAKVTNNNTLTELFNKK